MPSSQFRPRLLASTALITLWLALPGTAAAQDATWLASPGSGDFNTGTNWSTGDVPTGSATFGASNTTNITISNSTTIGAFILSAGAPDYTVTNNGALTFEGAGIVTNGGSMTINLMSSLAFNNSSSAGSANISGNDAVTFAGTSTAGTSTLKSTAVYLLGQSTLDQASVTISGFGAELALRDTSSAGEAIIDNSKDVYFYASSSADHAVITNNGGGSVIFYDGTTASDAQITNKTGGKLTFWNSSTAGNATILNSGILSFRDYSTGGNATLVNGDSARVLFSSIGPNSDNKLSLGSIAGKGTLEIFQNELTVGGNNSSTEFSGSIIGDGGALTKIGTGTLTLAGSNIHTGNTTINGGSIVVDGSTVDSDVFVNSGGTLAGTGSIGRATINSGGTLAPGNSTTTLGTLTATGALTFNTGSYFNVTLSADGQNSKIDATSQTVTLNGGTVNATYLQGTYITRQYTLITGNVTGTFAALANTDLPSGFTASLLYSATGVTLDLQGSIDTDNLNGNQQSLATALNTAFNSGGSLPQEFLSIFALSGSTLTSALDQLSPQVYTSAQLASLFASQQFTTDLMSCRTAGDGAAAIVREGQCVWVKGRERLLDIDATATNLGVRDRTTSLSAGVQVSLGGNWAGGLAVGHDDTDTRSGNATSDGDRVGAGASLKYTAGPLQLAAALSGAWGTTDTTRTVTVPGLAATLTGKGDTETYTAMLRAAYVVEWGGLYAKPIADVSFTHVAFGTVTETGGAAALRLDGGDQGIVTLSPALEIGANERADWIMPGAWFRPYVRAGISWRDTDSLAISGSFIAAQQTFTTTSELARITTDLAAGIDIVTAGNSAVRIEYNGRFADNLDDNSLSLKGSLPF